MDTLLYEVFSKLGVKEKEILTITFKHERKESSKLFKLLELLSEDKLKTDLEFSKSLYGGFKVESKYSHLKSDLLFEILRVVVFSTSHNAIKDSSNLYNRVHFSVYHLAIEILFYKHDVKLSFQLLELLEKKLSKEGFKDEYEYLLELKSNLFSNSISSLDKLKLFQELEDFAKRKVNRSFVLHKLKALTDLVDRGLFFGKSTNDLKVYSIDISDDLYTVIYKYRYNILVEYCNADFLSSLEYAKKLSKYIQQYSKSSSDAGGIQLIMANHYLLQYNYENAIYSFVLARSHFFKRGSNEKSALFGLARVYLHIGNNLSCKECLLELSQFELLKNEDKEQIELFNAVLDFRDGNFQNSLNRLYRLVIYYQHRHSWRVFIKLFELYLLFELSLYDIVDSKLDSFRKSLSLLKGEISIRYNFIYKIMYYIYKNKNNSDFLRKLKVRVDSLKSLSGHDKWNPIGFEILSFEEWIHRRYKINISKEDLQLYYSSDNTEQSANKD